MKRLVAEGAAVNEVPAGVSTRSAQRERGASRGKHRVLIAVCVILSLCAILAGTYAAGVYYFADHYFPGTSAMGVDASFKTQEELERALAANVESYKMHVGGSDLNFEVASTDIGLTCNEHEVAERLMSYQDSSNWPLATVLSDNSEEGLLSFDSTRLAGIVSTAVAEHNKQATQPVSATFRLNDNKDEFVPEKEKPGTALLPNAVYRKVELAVARGESSVTVDDSMLAQPQIREDSPAFEDALKRANNLLHNNVELGRGQKTLWELVPETFASWLTVRDDLSLAVNQQAATEWAAENLWHTANYSDDKNVYMVDSKAFADAFAKGIRWGAGSLVQIPYTHISRYLPGGGTLNPTPWRSDLGRYIDICKKSQVASMFDESGRVLWESPVTTGNEAKGNGTPLGQFSIYDKKTNFVLIGFDKDMDGKPDYEQPVSYWMPFNGGVGLHDASWRSTFGGDTYLEHGSGGCINLPRDAAAALYSMAYVDDVVVVHN